MLHLANKNFKPNLFLSFLNFEKELLLYLEEQLVLQVADETIKVDKIFHKKYKDYKKFFYNL